MHKTLIQKAYEKAERKRFKKGDNDPSKGHIFEDISEYLKDEHDIRIGGKRLEQNYNDALDLKHKKEDIKIKQLGVVIGLYNYLGFDTYEGFLYSIMTWQEKVIFFLKKNKQALLISLITIFITLYITYTRGQRWMIWQDDRYVEVSFNLNKYDYDQLKILDASEMRDFRKIKFPNCYTQYFDYKGNPITWYWKRGRNDLEIYTAPGLHPINGETLKKITRYMIKEHICKEQ